MGTIKDLTGKKFHRLLVLEYLQSDINRKAYWLCLCDCGNKVKVAGRHLVSGATKSCGCLRSERSSEFAKSKVLPKGESSINTLFYIYQKNAKNRNLEFNLTLSNFKNLISSNCFYCGIEPKNRFYRENYNGDYIHNGIDRIDSSKGYSLENCVPCCKTCNYAKNNLTQDEFKDWIVRIYNNYIKNVTP